MVFFFWCRLWCCAAATAKPADHPSNGAVFVRSVCTLSKHTHVSARGVCRLFFSLLLLVSLLRGLWFGIPDSVFSGSYKYSSLLGRVSTLQPRAPGLLLGLTTIRQAYALADCTLRACDVRVLVGVRFEISVDGAAIQYSNCTGLRVLHHVSINPQVRVACRAAAAVLTSVNRESTSLPI